MPKAEKANAMFLNLAYYNPQFGPAKVAIARAEGKRVPQSEEIEEETGEVMNGLNPNFTPAPGRDIGEGRGTHSRQNKEQQWIRHNSNSNPRTKQHSLLR